MSVSADEVLPIVIELSQQVESVVPSAAREANPQSVGSAVAVRPW